VSAPNGQQGTPQLLIIQVSKLIALGIKGYAIYLCMVEMRVSVEALAGKITLASLGLSGDVDAELKLAPSVFIAALGVLFGVLGCAYGLNQRSLRQGVIESLGKRYTDLELVIDPQRSGSNLTRRGKTNPKDEQ
jgi:hypothetical protein